MLVLSLKSPSSTWTGAFAPAEGLRDLCQTVCVPGGGARTLPYHCAVSAYLLSLFLYALSPLISDCLNLLFEMQVRSRRPKPFSYQQEMGDVERLLC